MVIGTGRYQWRNKQLGQWNRINSPETDLYKFSQQVIDKGEMSIQSSKDSLSTNGQQQELLDIYMQKKKYVWRIYTLHKINSINQKFRIKEFSKATVYKNHTKFIVSTH